MVSHQNGSPAGKQLRVQEMLIHSNPLTASLCEDLIPSFDTYLKSLPVMPLSPLNPFSVIDEPTVPVSELIHIGSDTSERELIELPRGHKSLPSLNTLAASHVPIHSPNRGENPEVHRILGGYKSVFTRCLKPIYDRVCLANELINECDPGITSQPNFRNKCQLTCTAIQLRLSVIKNQYDTTPIRIREKLAETNNLGCLDDALSAYRSYAEEKEIDRWIDEAEQLATVLSRLSAIPPGTRIQPPVSVTTPSVAHSFLNVVETQQTIAPTSQYGSRFAAPIPRQSVSSDRPTALETIPISRHTPPQVTQVSSGRPWSAVPLPAIEIPTFDGNRIKYNEFITTFHTFIGSNPDLRDVDKLVLLRKYLSGHPQLLVERLNIEPVNYGRALQLLKAHYDKPEARRRAIIFEINSLPQANNDLAEIQRTYLRVCALIAEWEKSETISDHHLARALIDHKFPKEITRFVLSHERRAGHTFTVHEFLECINQKIEDDQYQLDYFGQSVDRIQPALSRCSAEVAHIYTTLTPSDSFSCCFCESNHHKRIHCPIYRDAKSRREVLLSRKQIPICWICFDPNHRSRNCVKPRCPNCGDDHSHILCMRPKREDPRRTLEEIPQMDYRNRAQPPIPAPRSRNLGSNATIPPIPPRSHVAKESPSSANDPLVIALSHAETRSNNSRLLVAKLRTPLVTLHPMYSLMDTGAQRSLVLQSTADSLRLNPISTLRVTVQGVGGLQSTIDTKIYQVPISLTNNTLFVLSCIGVPQLIGNVNLDVPDAKDRNHLMSLQFSPLDIVSGRIKPDIIIGVDYFWKLWGTSTTIPLPSGLSLHDTLVGPLISGRVSSHSPITSHQATIACSLLHEKPFYDSEEILEDKMQTLHDMAWKEFHSSVSRDLHTKRISVALPFAEKPDNLPNNYGIAATRLRNLVKRFQQTTKWETYSSVIQGQLDEGILERVPRWAYSTNSPHYFIPHTAVFKESSHTTKLRIVLDASSHAVHASSLNDILLQGAVLLPDLRRLLISTRVCNVLVISDVAKAFHQIELHPEHRDFTRILWLKDVSSPPTSDNIIQLRHTRLPFGITSSPFLLAASILYHLSSKDTKLAREIPSCLYVDNLILGRDTVSIAIRDSLESIALFEELGMNLREFQSNEKHLLKALPSDEVSDESKMSVLGMKWDSDADTFSLSLPNPPESSIHTRREAMSLLASIYDPIGIISPSILNLRLLMNDTWVNASDYDAKLPSSATSEWTNSLRMAITSLSHLSIPRISASITPQLPYNVVIFADASAKAVGAVAYLVCLGKSELICSKSLTSPKGTIPKLELVALLVAFEMVASQLTHLPPPVSFHFFSDSETVLKWVYGHKSPQDIFVRNRLKKIANIYHDLQMKSSVTVRHVSTHDNPADMASRGVDVDTLMGSPLWFHGPAFTPFVTAHSPAPFSKGSALSYLPHLHQTIITAVTQFSSRNRGPPSVCLEDYSSLNRIRTLCKVFGAGLRLLYFQKFTLKSQTLLKERLPWLRLFLEDEPNWYVASTKLAVRIHQSKIRENLHTSRWKKYDCFMDEDGLIRYRGRFRDSCRPLRPQPWLLDGKSKFATTIVSEYHQRNMHSGRQLTMSQVGKAFWPVPFRSTVKTVISACTYCRRHTGRPFNYPTSLTLPSYRLQMCPPFSEIGIEEAGPIQVRTMDGSVIKVHILLVTCLVTRGIHLELLTRNDSEHLCLAMRRLFARYRVPRRVLLDNASIHVSTAQFLQHPPEFYCPLKYLFNSLHIIWKFITPLSPWQGGIYERLVGSVKQSLRKAIGDQIVSLALFETILCEITHLINSRPLTPVDSDGISYLTPRNLLYPYDSRDDLTSESVHPTFGKNSKVRDQLVHTYDIASQTLSVFWSNWYDDYLNILKSRALSNVRSLQPSQMLPSPGQVVLCTDFDKSKKKWHLGLIVSVQADSGGYVQTALVRHSNGVELKRPVSSLIPLELFVPEDK